MSEETQKGEKLSSGAKAMVDFVPLGIFMIAYFFGQRLLSIASAITGADWSINDGDEMFLAVGLFLPAFFAAFIYSVWKERRVAPMLLVTGVTVGILGSLTLILQNKTFFYMKPTIIYTLFAVALIGGLLSERNFLKILFDGALQLSDEAWKTLTQRYAVFFAVLALINEVAWRYLTRDCDLGAQSVCAGEAHWVNLKVFGFTVISLLFTAAQAPFIAKHMQSPPQSS